MVQLRSAPAQAGIIVWKLTLDRPRSQGMVPMTAQVRSRAKYALQQIKHTSYLASRRTKSWGKQVCWATADRINPHLAELTPYQFDPSRYRRSFLVRSAPIDDEPSELPRRVLCCWTGDNELTPNRKRNLDLLRTTLGVDVVLVTQDNLSDWIVAERPLHWAYEYLSLVHRSDYLHAYLMHHHGGGYVGIKEPLGSWNASFDAIEGDSSKWLLGYREVGVAGVTRAPGNLGADLRRYYSKLIGCGAMIVRSHTPFTAEWLREVERRMDYYAPQLVEFSGGTRGGVVGYPVSWTRLMGRIFHPLSLKYMDRLLIDDRVKVRFEDYM